MLAKNLAQAAGNAAGQALYVEDVFSTYLYTGNGSTQTITNGIDLAGEGGLVWIKCRSVSTYHDWFDTARGVGNYLFSNTTDANINSPGYDLTAFNSNGFSLGPNGFGGNASGQTYASWTFRKAPKFFDVVTYTGDGVDGRVFTHNFDSAVGMVIVKNTSSTANWNVWHRNATSNLCINSTGAESSTDATYTGVVRSVTDTTFTLYAGGGGISSVNQNGDTYVAYLFAHNAGGFGDDGEQNVISCGSFTTDGSGNATVNLGWEPQWVIAKRTDGANAWDIQDNMRGFTAKPTTYSANPILFANDSNAEITGGANTLQATATGFTTDNISYNANTSYIYIAIRRPMKTPTSGTEVLALGTSTSDSSGYTLTSNFPVDSYWYGRRAGGSQFGLMERLTNARLFTASTSAGGSVSGYVFWDSNVNVRRTGLLGSASTVDYAFRRAPGFFDEVCYTGGGYTPQSVPHNLGVVPEFIVTKRRDSTGAWLVYSATTGLNNYLLLNTDSAVAAATNYTAVSSTAFNAPFVNAGGTFVSYLFASCPGVSKVGSYTGNGTTQTINCGFAGGARFVLIKRTDSTGDWYVYDTARGMTTLTDPYLLLNSTAAESATLGSVTTVTTGFEVNASILAAINTNGASYIYLAIA